MKTWHEILQEEKQKPYFRELIGKLEGKIYYPPAPLTFRALDLCPLADTKVVILGQDPYINYRQANGLAFSVPKGESVPPSLQNIYGEIERDLKIQMPDHGDLDGWARQGVLLLNSVLSVEPGSPLSHHDIGWQNFTDRILNELARDTRPKVFMLWGNYARQRKGAITGHRHMILETTHPSPLSAYRGFMGCGHFSQANLFLRNNGALEINWGNL